MPECRFNKYNCWPVKVIGGPSPPRSRGEGRIPKRKRRKRRRRKRRRRKRRRRGFICNQKHANVCKLTRRTPNAVARHRLKPQVCGTPPRLKIFD